jgi:adenosylcobinamide-phosphate synthase
MFEARMLAAAYLLDFTCGDPQGFPHPVRLIGTAIARGERFLLPWARGNARKELVAGALLACAITGAAFATTASALRSAHRCDRRFGAIVTVLAASTTLATHDLLREVRETAHYLATDDLPAARKRLARIVGRDTAELPANEIARAAIETLAESLCDGVVAPLCALVLGGVPAAAAYKAINTLDSMIGHIEPPYTFFGRVAARMDDIANYLPARITALLIIVCGGAPLRALRVTQRDAALHRSPNAGVPEAAVAGALGVRLSGENTYEGIPHPTPFIGGEFREPGTAKVYAALRLTCTVSLAAGVLATLARGVMMRFIPKPRGL